MDLIQFLRSNLVTDSYEHHHNLLDSVKGGKICVAGLLHRIIIIIIIIIIITNFVLVI
jgi:hypothetical protein